MKVLEAIKEAISHSRRFFAYEFFPPKTEAAVKNLYDRMERMSAHGPLFCGITWGDGGTTADASLDIAHTAQTLLSLNMQLNITCSNTPIAELRTYLNRAKEAGITNLLLLRGARGKPDSDLPHAVDFVKMVRKEFGDHFGLAVAGSPEMQGDEDYDTALRHLKAKVDAGADLIITQVVFDAQAFLKFCQDCRALGILCPILPGIMPINTFSQFRRCRAMTSSKGAAELEDKLVAVRGDDDEVRRVASEQTIAMIKALFRNGVRGVYFYTMNLESAVVRVITGADLGRQLKKELPWKASTSSHRQKEEVRPIFWSMRPKSYLAMTSTWDDFPNGRWGDSASPAFLEDTAHHTQLLLGCNARHSWFHAVARLEDLCGIFLTFLEGRGKLPWCEQLEPEADLIMEDVLKPLNRRGLLTINSQPRVNGAPSSSPKVGWGPEGGYVYQKQYLEFFCSPEALKVIVDIFDKFPALTYMALDRTNTSVCIANTEGVNAVTWGVFPGREILQPTICSDDAFKVWSVEAFRLWVDGFKDGTEVPPTIQHICDSWILVNVVDNDYVNGVMSQALHDICHTLPVLTTCAATPHVTKSSSRVHRGDE